MGEGKKQLREKFLQQRQNLSWLQWREKSRLICAHLKESPFFAQSRVVLAYSSIAGEPDLSFLWQQDEGKRVWGLPRCQGKDLVWHQWLPHTPLLPGKYNIPEPPADSPVISPSQVDLILVPAVACDYRGYRLGYGGGYYDRLLSDQQWQKPVTIGIVFDFAYVEQLVTHQWDKPLDYVCTESGLKPGNKPL